MVFKLFFLTNKVLCTFKPNIKNKTTATVGEINGGDHSWLRGTPFLVLSSLAEALRPPLQILGLGEAQFAKQP